MTAYALVLVLLFAVPVSAGTDQATVTDYTKLTETERYLYVSGYLSGFAVAALAAQGPPGNHAATGTVFGKS